MHTITQTRYRCLLRMRIIQFDSTIFKIDEKNDYFIVTAFIKHSEDIEKKLEKYIYKRETELIEEFKNSYLHN